MTVFRVRFISFEPLVGLPKTNLLKCQLCWDDVQCLCLTKVGSWSRSEFKIKHCMTVFHAGSISFEPLVWFRNCSAQMSRMIKNVQCLCLTNVCSMSRSQFKIKHCMTVFRVRSISFEPLVGFTNNFAPMSSKIMCAVPIFDQGRFKVKVTVNI